MINSRNGGGAQMLLLSSPPPVTNFGEACVWYSSSLWECFGSCLKQAGWRVSRPRFFYGWVVVATAAVGLLRHTADFIGGRSPDTPMYIGTSGPAFAFSQRHHAVGAPFLRE